jgi:hypothetical protein
MAWPGLLYMCAGKQIVIYVCRKTEGGLTFIEVKRKWEYYCEMGRHRTKTKTTFDYDFLFALENRPIRTIYWTNTMLWLDNFGERVQKWMKVVFVFVLCLVPNVVYVSDCSFLIVLRFSLSFIYDRKVNLYLNRKPRTGVQKYLLEREIVSTVYYSTVKIILRL